MILPVFSHSLSTIHTCSGIWRRCEADQLQPQGHRRDGQAKKRLSPKEGAAVEDRGAADEEREPEQEMNPGIGAGEGEKQGHSHVGMDICRREGDILENSGA